MIAAQADSAAETEIDRLLCEAAQLALPLSPLEPLNSVEEKAKVAADPRYNPRFVYPPQDRSRLQEMSEALAQLTIATEGVGRFFLEARSYLRARLQLRMHLGDDEHWRHPLYEAAPPDVMLLARSLLADPPPRASSTKRPFTAAHLLGLIQARLKQYGLRDWTVQAKANLSATNTDSANRVISVRGDIAYSLEEMKRLVVHEVDTHVLRAANGASQPYRIFSVGAVPSYLMTEEGLAVVNEERMGYIDVPRTRIFAGRVLAAARALTSSFVDVYTEQRDYGFSHDEAWVTAKRVKRGLADTSKPGGFIKDQAYLWGRLIVEEYVVRGGDLSRLYVGKVSLAHLPLLPELGLRPARHIPLPYS